MIKKIQLRGISNSPSDRMTEDGGCRESLNVMLDNGELIPAPSPEDITAKIGLVQTVGQPDSYELLFIHKTASYTNYIAYNLDTRAVGTFDNGVFIPIFTISNGDAIDVTSMGNILVVLSVNKTYYAIYDDGKYLSLDSQVPAPAVEFNLKYYSHSYVDTSYTPGEGSLSNPKFWEEDTEVSLRVKEGVYQRRDERLNLVRSQGYFYAPMFIRYAVKLYDGTYIRQSVPILLGAGKRYAYENWISGGSIKGDVLNIFKIDGRLADFTIGNWKKYIQSVDFFISPMCKYPADKAKIVGLDTSVNPARLIYEKKRTTKEEDSEIENRLLGLSNFYLIASFPIEEFMTFIGKEIPFDKVKDIERCTMEEYLTTLPTLPDDFKSNHSLFAKKCKTYNNRLILCGVTQELYTGYPFLNATRMWNAPDVQTQDPQWDYVSAQIRFFVKDAFGESHNILCRGVDGSNMIAAYGATQGTDIVYQDTYGWIAYPDPNCYKAEYTIDRMNHGGTVETYGFSIDMKPHPNLACAYGYFGIDKNLLDVTKESVPALIPEDKYIHSRNKIFQSEFENPFFFPASGIHTVSSGDILDMSGITKPLSSGQFGQFPLYVFTTEGIWALSTTPSGTFGSSSPVSMDVMITSNLTTSLEQSIVFRTRRGLMLMTGSDIVCISDNMRGKQVVIPNEAVPIFDGTLWEDYIMNLTQKNVSFNDYLDGADASYDSEGNRLIVFNREYPFHYVYYFSSQTWHKGMIFLDNMFLNLDSSVNSYPECYINAFDGSVMQGKGVVLNMSTRFRNTGTQPVIIQTRSYDLAEPDIRKVIKDIRIRGKHAKGMTKYVLLGSNDGITYHVIRSLKSSSWKFFKMIIVGNLKEGESISWLELEYDTKFTNRMR